MVFRDKIKGMAALALFVSLLSTATPLPAKELECNINDGPCSVTSAQRTVTLNIEPKPVSPMQELSFTVTISPCDRLPDKLLLDLSMPGMMMGKNQVTLQRTTGCTYKGKGVIVRCMSGRTLWQATLLSELLDNPAFIFNVRK
ncbi:hypothetical protein G9409_06070 [Chlorobium sp. BLA1]|uniref:hypothetical protein n=1 Tax=Candidatus Chlorobium masyuteum TaxID=2716876 RepID=UPI00142015F3|nr:hypothetical protein [Candidatus Chlorobium masyuteum]NHQ60160.1 hypothetical protein [Candidatus Chlorobium masyuteum]